MQTVADSSSAQNMSHLGLTMSSPCVGGGGGGGEPPIVLRVVVWWCAGWCGGHPCLLRTTATSHPFTRVQVSTTPPWPGGSGHTMAIMLIVIHKYKCVPVPLYSLHRSAQDVVTSSSVCWVSCAQPGHGAIVITYLNISTILPFIPSHHHHHQPLACFRYSLQIPASAHVAAGRSIQCQNCQILLQFISTMLIYSCS